MRILLLVTVTAACMPMPTRECVYGKAANGLCYNAPAFPPVARHERVTTEKEIEGFTLKAVPVGAVGWGVRVTNKTDALALVVWDESTFTTSASQSAGRLINGDTRKIDSAKAQPSTPIAPGANMTQFMIPESYIDAHEREADAAQITFPTQRQVDAVTNERFVRAKQIVGGKLYVTVQSASGKQMWVGVVIEAK